jgi:hypothetical protein
MIIKVEPCFSDPKRGGMKLDPINGEEVAERALKPPL